MSKAQNDLQRTSVDAASHAKVLEETTEKFEQTRIQDMKNILKDFVHIEMIFHAKACPHCSIFILPQKTSFVYNLALYLQK